MRKLQRELRREFPFAEIETSNGNHFRILLPNGRSVYASSTPSCSSYLHNVRRDVQRQMKPRAAGNPR